MFILALTFPKMRRETHLLVGVVLTTTLLSGDPLSLAHLWPLFTVQSCMQDTREGRLATQIHVSRSPETNYIFIKFKVNRKQGLAVFKESKQTIQSIKSHTVLALSPLKLAQV